MNATQTLEFLQTVAEKAADKQVAQQVFDVLRTKQPEQYQQLVKMTQNLKKATLRKLTGHSGDLQGLTPDAVAAWSVFVGPRVYDSDVDQLLNWMAIKMFTEPETVRDKQDWLSLLQPPRLPIIPIRKAPEKLLQALQVSKDLEQAGFRVPPPEQIKQWSATQLTTYLNNVGKLLATPRPAVKKLEREAFELKAPSTQPDCHWVEPNQPGIYMSPSRNFSMLALITCVTEGIPLKALFTAWWSWVNTVARPVYEAHRTDPIPERVWYVWNAVRSSSNFCFGKKALNYLHSILDYGKCQCSCGVNMLLELMKSLDPSIKLSGILRPGHMALIVYDAEQVPFRVETTARSKTIIRYDPQNPDMAIWTLFSPMYNSLLHTLMWMRIFLVYFESKTQISVSDFDLHVKNTMCNLQTIFHKLPKVLTKKIELAFLLFYNFAGYAAAIVEHNSPLAKKRAVVYETLLKTPKLPPRLRENFTHYFQVLETISQSYEKLDDKKCDTVRSPDVQKQLQAGKRKLFTLKPKP
jgi:hypothetical protein